MQMLPSLAPQDPTWLLGTPELPTLFLTRQPWTQPSTSAFPDEFRSRSPQPLSVALQGQSLLKPGAKGSKAPEEMKAAVPMLPQTGMLALHAPSHPHCHCFLYYHSASALSLEFCPQRLGPLPHLRTPHTARCWVSGSRGTGETLLWLLVVILTSPRSVTQGGLGRHDKIKSTEFKSCPFCLPPCDQGAGCLPVQTPSFPVYKTELRNLA